MVVLLIENNKIIKLIPIANPHIVSILFDFCLLYFFANIIIVIIKHKEKKDDQIPKLRSVFSSYIINNDITILKTPYTVIPFRNSIKYNSFIGYFLFSFIAFKHPFKFNLSFIVFTFFKKYKLINLIIENINTKIAAALYDLYVMYAPKNIGTITIVISPTAVL